MDSSKKEKMLETVRKLLALSSNNPNENEAISAALKAQKLMAKYDIDESEVSEKIDVEDIVDKKVYVGSGKKWKYLLASVISKNFKCKAYTQGNETVVFYGYESDVKIATQVFQYLFVTGNRLGKEYVKKIKSEGGTINGVFNSYVTGFLNGIRENLEKQCRALMIVTPQQVEEEFKILTDGYRKRRTSLQVSDKQAMDAGEYDARNIVNGRSIDGRKQKSISGNSF